MLPKSKRVIKYVFIHCAATPPNRNYRAADIDRWHKAQGWSGIGYNGVICRDGAFELGRHVDKIPAQAKGYNRNAIAVCLIGGLGDDLRPSPDYTYAQWRTLDKFIQYAMATYPGAKIVGHNQFSSKACPSFDVQVYLRSGRVVPFV